MNVTCSAEPCPVILNAICVFYQGENLIYTGINTNDNLQTALEKIDAKFADAFIGYIFNNGVIQTAPGQPVQLGGSLVQNTVINSGGYTFEITGSIESGAFITTGGTSSQFVKGDGSLDSTSYQPSGNYITALTGDGTASGPGSVPFTLATVNAFPGVYGGATSVPVVTVNSKGLVTSVTTTPVSFPAGSLLFNGDVSGSGFTGSMTTLTLATVNSNVYGSNTALKFAVNGKGLVTSAAPITALDIFGIIGFTPVPNTRTITINGVTQNLSSNVTWNVGTVTSVQLTMPPAFTVTTPPITSAGTINVVASGTAAQYIKGDGTLGTAPIASSGTSGSSGVNGTSGTSGYAGDKYRTTSTDCFTLGNSGVITVALGLAYTPAQSIIIVYNTTNFQECEVVSYNPLTGVLVFAAPTRTVGSGNYCSWTVNLDGASGGDGSSGTSGTSGVNGTSGSSGSSSTSGTSGTNGSAGTSGTDGTGGTSGSSGSSGTSGINGTSGSSGTSGATGSSGTNGTSGTSGSDLSEIAVSGVQDSSNKTFTLGSALTMGTYHQFFINGQLMTYTDDYTISGTTLTIATSRPAPTASDILRLFGAIGASSCVGIPVGGTSGQVLAKVSSTNYDVTWVDQTGGGGGGSGSPALFNFYNFT